MRIKLKIIDFNKADKLKVFAAILFFIVILVLPFGLAAKMAPECNDGMDNDGDGLVDLSDPHCKNTRDRSESEGVDGAKVKSECNDKKDNDGDGYKDMDDRGCTDRKDNDESNCGDGICEGGEGCATCIGDCGACPPPLSCTDTDGGTDYYIFGEAVSDTDSEQDCCRSLLGFCTSEGSKLSEAVCEDDQPSTVIYECPNGCRDGVCISGIYCGDGYCNGDETCSTCPSDCGTCPPYCGDGTCNINETCTTCIGDCGACSPTCGDGTCSIDESCISCPTDCGACSPDCTETDGGVDYNNRGTVTIPSGSYTDECDSSGVLQEFYCDNGGYGEVLYTCPNGCSDGACLISEECVDTDNGLDFFTKGTTSGVKWVGVPPDSWTDFCYNVGGVDKGLAEHYCTVAGLVERENYICSSSCSDGACVSTSPFYCGDGNCDAGEHCAACPADCGECPTDCTDSDGGFDPFTRGTTDGEWSGTPQVGPWTDFCYTYGDGMAEYFCTAENKVYRESYTCPDGCSNGACVGTSPPNCPDGNCDSDETCETCPGDCGDCPITCTDTDGGEDLFTLGSCSDSRPMTASDHCYDLNMDYVVEASCHPENENRCYGAVTPCPGGYTCQGGICVSSPSSPSSPSCGDGNCDSDESCSTCSTDCGACLPGDCTDTDGGVDLFVVGSCSDWKGQRASDHCYDLNMDYVVEASCHPENENQCYGAVTPCPSGYTCQGGICVSVGNETG